MILATISHEPYLQVTEEESYLETLEFPKLINAAFLAEHEVKGLHYGCGAHLIGGMLNLDSQIFGITKHIRIDGIGKMAGTVPLAVTNEDGKTSRIQCTVPPDKPALFYSHNAVQTLQIDDHVFDYVLSHHFIEHIKPADALVWLTNVKRTMKPGAVLRISTPDLRLYVEGYLDPVQKFYREHRQILNSFGISQVDTKAQMLNQIFQCWGHRFIYDFEDLKLLLEEAGFNRSNISKCEFRSGKISELSAMDLILRVDESLYVEAIA